MLTLFAWFLSSLLFYAVATAHETQATTDFPQSVLQTTVTLVRIDVKNQSYPRQHQFRRRGENPWLGTVRYKWRAFNRTWLLDLQPNLRRSAHLRRHRHRPHQLQVFNVASPDIRDQVRDGCYYTGRLLDDCMSFVAVSLCGGMTGDIYSKFGSYVIHPSPTSYANDDEFPILHDFSPWEKLGTSRLWRPHAVTRINFCVVEDDRVASKVNHQSSSTSTPNLPAKWPETLVRKRRSESRELHLEVLVVADGKMVQYHGSNLKHYILTLMATVALIYKDPSIGNNINIAVVDIAVLDESVDYDVIHTVAPTTLRKFCSWQQKHNHPDDRDPTHHDAAILITREDLCRFPGACDTLGLAQSGMMCDPYSSCAIVEDNGLSAAFTIAHELGHVMSIPHDDDRKCSKHLDEKKKLHVMARMLDYNSHPWSWSECSRHFVTTFFDVGYGHCLTDRPARNLLDQDEQFQQPPGQLYSRDRQCQLVFGPKSRICPYMPECKRLWCTMDEGTQGGCRTQHMPWADGTHCDNGKRCYQGECVRLTPTRLTPVDGQWGEWRPFGKCSRTCGGGIQQALRECDSPKPVNGGRYCTGVRVKYKPCNTQDCPLGSRDFREEQCAEFNGRRMNLPGLPSSVKWVPHYIGIVRSDQCKLYCHVAGSPSYFVLREKVVDGTKCTSGSYDICVNGNCEPAGCDHVLGSKKTLDRCGVCGGTNTTCKEITGRFDKTVDYGYHDVIMIPPGASNIQIKQHSLDNETDDNYIVLKDPDNNYILNGDYMISMFPKTLQYNGITIDYSGSDAVVEQLNTTEPLKKDVYVQVLIVGKLQPPRITFSYTVPISDGNLYSWQPDNEYTECSKLCNGVSFRNPVCVRRTDHRQVSDGHCLKSLKPVAKNRRPCNQNCTLKWQDVSKSECSVLCGRGIRQRIIKCMKEDLETKVHQAVPEELCSHIRPKPASKEVCRGNCLNSTWIFTEWSECSTSCGSGVQKRSAECQNVERKLQPDSHCPMEDRITSRLCNLGRCPQWNVGEWTKCSVSCGRGKRQRPYWCHLEKKIIAPWYCDLKSKPLYTEVCKQPLCAQWKTEEWRSCSAPCGDGVMRRNVYCIGPHGDPSEDYFCSTSERPAGNKNCNHGPCPAKVPGSYKVFKKRPIPSMSLIRDKAVMPPVPNDGRTHLGAEKGIWKTGEWSKCSVMCGEGHRNRKLTCHDPDDDSRISLSYCDYSTKPILETPCENYDFCSDWVTDQWSQCVCPSGFKYRQVTCPHEDTHGTTCDLSKKPLSEETCSCDIRFRHHHIHRWESGPWTQCSTTCGLGNRQRLIACVNGQGKSVDPRKCSGDPPTREESCKNPECNFWQWSDWSPCSKTCGNGTQSRHPNCVHSSIENCNVASPEYQVCDTGKSCRTFRWRKGSWSRCSESCGRGYKTREVVCWDGRHRRTSADNCDGMEKPRDRKPCMIKPCEYMWVTGHWSECSRTCGDGSMTRSVACHRVNIYGWVDPDPVSGPLNFPNGCDESKRPKDMKSCNYGNCNKGFVWKPESWSVCSGKCGKQRQRRKLNCYDDRGKKVLYKYCNRKQKLQRKRRCKEPSLCKPQSCQDIRKMDNKQYDGNYTVYIKGKPISVYCHSMNSSTPKNYITLDDNNYSHIFTEGTRWSNYEQCSHSDSHSSCDCNRTDFGLTRFNKIAINTTTLQVITNDFTFSHTYYGKDVPYATAGDCIRTPRCLQGKFSISLIGTGLRVSELSTWSYSMSYIQKTIHRTEGGQVVRGICGGYCSFCAPQPKFGLLLDIIPS